MAEPRRYVFPSVRELGLSDHCNDVPSPPSLNCLDHMLGMARGRGPLAVLRAACGYKVFMMFGVVVFRHIPPSTCLDVRKIWGPRHG